MELPWAATSALLYKTILHSESTLDPQLGSCNCGRKSGDFDARHKLVLEWLKALEAQGLKVCEEE